MPIAGPSPELVKRALWAALQSLSGLGSDDYTAGAAGLAVADHLARLGGAGTLGDPDWDELRAELATHRGRFGGRPTSRWWTEADTIRRAEALLGLARDEGTGLDRLLEDEDADDDLDRVVRGGP
jgi:hypothetical protein